jgi:putative colanic acid biosysnthesis UDP-glucose lipid carrier transferase
MSTFIKILFFIADLLFLNAAILISFKWMGATEIITSDSSYLLIFSDIAWFFLVLVSNPYNINKGWSVIKIIKSQTIFIFIHLLVIASLVLFFKKEYSLFQIILIYLLFIPLFFSWKILSYYLRKVFTSEVPFKNYIIIGKNETSAELRKYYMLNPELGYRFLAYFENDLEGLPIDRIRQYCVSEEVHEIICVASHPNDPIFKLLVDFGLDSLIKVRLVVNPDKSSQQFLKLDQTGDRETLDVVPIFLDKSQNQLIKRVFDVLFSSAFLILIMSWFLPIIALFIKLDSKGPVFFLQLRSGRDNKSFYCFKFRTMKTNQDADSRQATKNDSRITKLGGFLRKTSIDELPQFFNVFIGNMSVVGPRPHMLKHTEEYAILIEKFMGRHYVKPGITGLAQCMGYRGETQTVGDMENRVRLDRYYIENWTFWFDIKIIFLTIISLIRGSDKAF